MAIIKPFRIKSFKSKKPIIALKNISISFNKKHQILDNISLNVMKGEVFGLLGPNGAGKSTIMNIISGLLKPSAGSVNINSISVTNYPIYLRSTKFKIALVPQIGGFFSNLSAEDNLKAISEILIEDEKDRLNKIEQLIAKFELDGVRKIEGKYLSGGLKRRLVIAMALIGDPEILLMDEPLAALDPQSIQMLQNIIVSLQTDYNLTVIVTDHQARDMMVVCDKIVVLANSKIIAHGTPQDVMKNEMAAKYYFGSNYKYK